MPERIELWWARRQFSRGAEVPYEIGRYRDEWARYPALIRQYHPELNAGITLSQIPPAADVLLLWQCEAGHPFVATPAEQRARPGRTRRRSAWCPECATLATGRGTRPRAPARSPTPVATTATVPTQPRARTPSRRPPVRICSETPDLPAGTAFRSGCAPAPASAVEARLRRAVFDRLAVSEGLTAITVSRPFFQHREIWPDLVLPELRVAIEYDSVGKHGLEHVGAREDADRRKDRLAREAGWEVIRIRTGGLLPLGPHDVTMPGLSRTGIERVFDALREIRGPLIVDAYLIGDAH